MGNVYMEADQVRFKDSTYRNLQTAVTAALEGGGGGGTTVVANPEGSATADLSKLQVGDSIYGIPATAAKIAYDNTSSGLTADDVQEAIDEINGNIPGVATTSAPGIVQPDGTSIIIADGVISAAGGSGGGLTLVKKIELLRSNFTLADTDFYQSITDYSDIYDSIKNKALLFSAYMKYDNSATLKEIAWNTAIVPPGFLENVAEFCVFRMSGLMAGYSGNMQSASTRKWIIAGLNSAAYNGWTNANDKLVIELYTL